MTIHTGTYDGGELQDQYQVAHNHYMNDLGDFLEGYNQFNAQLTECIDLQKAKKEGTLDKKLQKFGQDFRDQIGYLLQVVNGFKHLDLSDEVRIHTSEVLMKLRGKLLTYQTSIELPYSEVQETTRILKQYYDENNVSTAQ